MKLLSITRDASIIDQIAQEGVAQNWSVKIVDDRHMVVECLKSFDPDVLIVDIEDIAELSWWAELRQFDPRPWLFMYKEVTEEILYRSFEVGADGVVPKSAFSRRYLVARMKAYLRRQSLGDGRRFVPRLGLVLDSQRYRVEVKGKILSLTLTEYKILRALSTDKEAIISRQEIQNQVFGESQVSRRSLDVHICALRKKLRPFDLDISSVRGVGYGLNPCAG